MDLPIMTMNRAAARQSFLEYRAAVRRSLDREANTLDEQKRDVLARARATDEALMLGYRQMSLGHQVIDLVSAIRQGGEDAQGRPRLAVARADQRTVLMRRWRDGSVQFTSGSYGHVARAWSRSGRQVNLRAGAVQPDQGIRSVPVRKLSTWLISRTQPPRLGSEGCSSYSD